MAVLAIGPPLAAQDQQNKKHVRYTVTDLGTLGGTFSIGRGVNNKGWASGNAFLRQDTAQHSVLWRTGRKIDLGTLGGPNSKSYVTRIPLQPPPPSEQSRTHVAAHCATAEEER